MPHHATDAIYELAYLASPDLSDEAITTFRNDVDALIVKHGGSIREGQEATRKRLAYPVGKLATAWFVSEYITLSPSEKAALEKALKEKTEIIRSLTLRVTETYLKRLRSKRIAPTPREDRVKPASETPRSPIVSEVSAPVKPTTRTAPEKSAEAKRVDIAEIEKKLDEILGREL